MPEQAQASIHRESTQYYTRNHNPHIMYAVSFTVQFVIAGTTAYCFYAAYWPLPLLLLLQSLRLPLRCSPWVVAAWRHLPSSVTDLESLP